PAARVAAREPDAQEQAAVVVEAQLARRERARTLEHERLAAAALEELARRQRRRPAREAHLAQPVAAPQAHRERERRHLEPRAPAVADRGLVEAREARH